MTNMHKEVKYEILDSTSELMVRIYGSDLASLFNNALFAMFDCIEPRIQKPIHEVRLPLSLKAIDTEQLLVDFLSEALFHSDTKNLAMNRVEFEELTPISLRAEIIGYHVVGFAVEIKAVTYHGARIIQANNVFSVEIIFDI